MKGRGGGYGKSRGLVLLLLLLLLLHITTPHCRTNALLMEREGGHGGGRRRDMRRGGLDYENRHACAIVTILRVIGSKMGVRNWHACGRGVERHAHGALLLQRHEHCAVAGGELGEVPGWRQVGVWQLRADLRTKLLQ